MKGDPKSDSNYHEYKELTEERFYEILDLSDMLYKDLITPEEFGEKVREDELADFRIMAQKKNYDYSKRKK